MRLLPFAFVLLVLLIGCGGGQGSATSGGSGGANTTGTSNSGEAGTYTGTYQREQHGPGGFHHVSDGDVTVIITPAHTASIDFSSDPDMSGSFSPVGQFYATYAGHPAEGFMSVGADGFWHFNVYFEFDLQEESRFAMELTKTN